MFIEVENIVKISLWLTLSGLTFEGLLAEADGHLRLVDARTLGAGRDHQAEAVGVQAARVGAR